MQDRLANSEIIKDLAYKAKKQEIRKEAKQETTFDNKEIKTSNNKATFNLSKKILRKLEDCWKEARYLTESKQISRALIVEKALEIALEEFNTKKQTSGFYSELVSNKEIKQ